VAEQFPWREVMGFGIGRLRMAPRDFWAATLRELVAAADALGHVRGLPMERAALGDLMARFPDERNTP
jgi:uncharacterized phage protein (TIGR02216 family)